MAGFSQKGYFFPGGKRFLFSREKHSPSLCPVGMEDGEDSPDVEAGSLNCLQGFYLGTSSHWVSWGRGAAAAGARPRGRWRWDLTILPALPQLGRLRALL